MAFFSFFKTPRHQKFKYVPRYYDPQKEQLDKIVAQAKGEGLSDTELAKARISSAFRKRGGGSNEYARRMTRRSNRLLIIILIVLFGLTYLLLTVYLPRFMQLFEG
ncbi:MAG: hypothetical protein OEM26_13085 [Saprospiraceae bacterium]|nr:hypothetical protein [Saprospiraceae bacterium]